MAPASNTNAKIYIGSNFLLKIITSAIIDQIAVVRFEILSKVALDFHIK